VRQVASDDAAIVKHQISKHGRCSIMRMTILWAPRWARYLKVFWTELTHLASYTFLYIYTADFVVNGLY
jgi:hypothetical protein